MISVLLFTIINTVIINFDFGYNDASNKYSQGAGFLRKTD